MSKGLQVQHPHAATVLDCHCSHIHTLASCETIPYFKSYIYLFKPNEIGSIIYFFLFLSKKISIPVGPFNTISKQPNKIFVSHSTNCFYLYFKFFFSLAPEKLLNIKYLFLRERQIQDQDQGTFTR